MRSMRTRPAWECALEPITIRCPRPRSPRGWPGRAPARAPRAPRWRTCRPAGVADGPRASRTSTRSRPGFRYPARAAQPCGRLLSRPMLRADRERGSQPDGRSRRGGMVGWWPLYAHESPADAPADPVADAGQIIERRAARPRRARHHRRRLHPPRAWVRWSPTVWPVGCCRASIAEVPMAAVSCAPTAGAIVALDLWVVGDRGRGRGRPAPCPDRPGRRRRYSRRCLLWRPAWS